MPSTGSNLATLTDCPDAVMIKEILDAGKTGKAGYAPFATCDGISDRTGDISARPTELSCHT